MRREQILVPVLRTASRRDWAMRLVNRFLHPFNPFDPARYDDPYPLYETLRAIGPVVYHERLRTWYVVGQDECEVVLRAPSSVDRSDLIGVISPYKHLSDETRDMFLQTMLLVDPPKHTRLRKIVSRAFTPRAVAALEPDIEKLTNDLISSFDPSETIDATAAFADRVPIYAISDMLGLPHTEREQLKRLSEGMIPFIDPITGFDAAAMEATVAEFRELVTGHIEARVKGPRDDMLSRLVAAEADGDRLSREELISMVALLLVAGHETTSGLISSALVAMHRFPQQRQLLIDRPELAANAVEEFLRFDSPVQNTERIVAVDVDLGGHRIPAGAEVGIMLGGANRDPRRHDRPNELLLDRSDPKPLSFGHGIHHCLGAALARLEARVALPAFVTAFPDYNVDETAMQWKRSTTVRGLSYLPITLGGSR